MNDRDKADYWLELCDYDIETAKAMLIAKRYLYVGFMCHQVAEKGMKAIVASITSDIPPKTHDLLRLAEIGCIAEDLSGEQLLLLDTLKPLQYRSKIPGT